MMERGLLFDLDGTLIDSLPDLTASVNHALDRLGRPPRTTDEVHGFIGDGSLMLLRRALGGDHASELRLCLEIFTEHYRENCLKGTTLYDGVAELLGDFCERYRLGVVTNKNHDLALIIMKGLGILERFEYVVGGDTYPVKKPDPQGANDFSEKYGIEPKNIVMIGDHVTDIKTGRNAGCKTVFCAYGFGNAEGLVADETVQSFRELPAALERLVSRAEA